MDIWDKELTESLPAMEKQETHIAQVSDEILYETSLVESIQEMFQRLTSYWFDYLGMDVKEKVHLSSFQAMGVEKPKGCGNSQQKQKSSEEFQASWFDCISRLLTYCICIVLWALKPDRCMVLFLLVLAACITGGHACDNILTRNDTQKEKSNDLHFSSRQLSVIASDACNFPRTVEIVDFTDNCLSNLPQRCFINRIALQQVHLRNNSFHSWPLALKNAGKSLLLVDMRDNPIGYLAKDDFEGNDNITVVKFGGCNIEYIHPQAMNKLKSLVTADFSENKLTSIPCIDITTVPNLDHMDFSKNLLESPNIPCFIQSLIVRNISITDDKMVVWTANKSIEFFISGNSETLKCEKIEEDILNANVPVNYNLSCQFQNGSVGRIAQQTSDEYFSTPVTPGGHDLSTPSPVLACNNGIVVLPTILCVVLLPCLVVALVFIHKLRKAKNYVVN